MKTLGKKTLWHKRFKNEDWGAEDQRGGAQMLGAERQQRNVECGIYKLCRPKREFCM